VLLAEAFRAEGDGTAAALELEGARAAFERLGAQRDAEHVAGMTAGPPTMLRAVRTFMFTDIVDSTRLVEALGDEAWDTLLAWHDRTLRSCFARHHGTEAGHEGDGFFVAFADARSAIECACDIQRALADHRRHHGFAPQVRIGLHIADATVRGGDYVGKGVHAAARVSAAAGASEVLVTRETLDAAGDGLTVTDERSLQLKGLAEAVVVATIRWR
jgi:class 3 adenylate cyclase